MKIRSGRAFSRLELHLESVREMIPFFHAAGHLAYAKSAHLYLQQMSVLEKRMPASEYEYFTKKGGFTIRRTHKMWAGIWSDMTIEQVLMRQLKVSGGLTHGRGMTDNATTQWVASLPACTELINQFEEFCDVAFLSGEQHVELRELRINRDISDVDKLATYLNVHQPFTSCPELFPIADGVTGDSSINCEQAVSLGRDAIKKIVGKSFNEVTLKRKDRVSSLAIVTNAVKLNGEEMPINHTQLTNRILCMIKNENDLARYITYEWAVYPPSLFYENGMLRKTPKSKLADVLPKPES